MVFITWNRPTYVREALKHALLQTITPHEIVVVDASADNQTAQVVADFPDARYVHFPRGAGHMTSSRNEALRHVTGDIVAFLDDDANVCKEWLPEVVRAFDDPTVGAVAGRTRNGLPKEECEGVDQIGKLLSTGELTGNFAADPGQVVDVDHGIGANMSFRREVLERLDGFRDDFPGTALREDTDIFIRTRAMGYRAVFAPLALADHVAAPHVRGRRFDYRYVFWGNHNHALLLARNFGLASPMFRRWLASAIVGAFQVSGRSPLRRSFRSGVALAGVTAGLVTSAAKARLRPLDPRVKTRWQRSAGPLFP